MKFNRLNSAPINHKNLEWVYDMDLEDYIRSEYYMLGSFTLGKYGVKGIKGHRAQVVARDNFTCSCCGRKADKVALVRHKNQATTHVYMSFFAVEEDGKYIEYTKDHIIPKALGGMNSMNNYQCMCQSCNATKGMEISTSDFIKAFKLKPRESTLGYILGKVIENKIIHKESIFNVISIMFVGLVLYGQLKYNKTSNNLKGKIIYSITKVLNYETL